MLPCPWVLQGRVWCARCMVYGVWCMQCSVVCLSRHGLVFTVTAFQAISGEESLPGLSAQGARDAETQDASQLLRSSTVTPRMSRKCPKCPSPVAVRSGCRKIYRAPLSGGSPAHNLCCTCVRTMRAEFTTQENWINVFSWPLSRPIHESIYNWYLWIVNTWYALRFHTIIHKIETHCDSLPSLSLRFPSLDL